MAGKVVNPSLVLLRKVGVSRQESASKIATSHIRKPLYAILRNTTTQHLQEKIIFMFHFRETFVALYRGQKPET